MSRKIFSEEHTIFRDAFRKFLTKELVPHIEEWEEEGLIGKDIWKKVGEGGYLCPWADEKYGGAGVGFEYSVIILEELVYAGLSSLWLQLHSDVIVPYINTFGDEKQKMKWIPGCVSGDIITAIAMTEPGAGSDLSKIAATAVKDGNEYVLNGQKTFISHGINADLIVVAAKTDLKADPAYKGLSLICVEGNAPGFSRGKKLKKMGYKGSDTAELIFEDCRVPVSNRLGEENKGFYYLMQKLQQERLIACIQAQAAAEAMLNMTVKYCQERIIFDKPVGSHQHNTFKLVDMATEIELGRTLVDDLISEFTADKDIVKRVSMGKAWIAEMANRIAYNCLQLYGGYGYMDEYPISRYARDVRAMPIFAGSTETMKSIIGRMMGF